MERICGKRSLDMDRATLASRMAGYCERLVDIGTGDGRFVLRAARENPACFALGIDACRENLRQVSRVAPGNALFLIADALALPRDLDGVATRVTINFPWGSLLAGLLDDRSALLAGLHAVMRPAADLEIRLNGGALAEAGWSLETGADRVVRTLELGGFTLGPLTRLDAVALRACPTSWARRLAGGRDPRAVHLRAVHSVGPGDSLPELVGQHAGGGAGAGGGACASATASVNATRSRAKV